MLIIIFFFFFVCRGHGAFCSLECRQQQVNLDEPMEECSLAPKKDVTSVSSTPPTGPQVSTKGETVVLTGECKNQFIDLFR